MFCNFSPGGNEPAKSQSLLIGRMDRILGGNTEAHTSTGVHNFNNCYQIILREGTATTKYPDTLLGYEKIGLKSGSRERRQV